MFPAWLRDYGLERNLKSQAMQIFLCRRITILNALVLP